MSALQQVKEMVERIGQLADSQGAWLIDEAERLLVEEMDKRSWHKPRVGYAQNGLRDAESKLS